MKQQRQLEVQRKQQEQVGLSESVLSKLYVFFLIDPVYPLVLFEKQMNKYKVVFVIKVRSVQYYGNYKAILNAINFLMF